jgi:hypothetical protein
VKKNIIFVLLLTISCDLFPAGKTADNSIKPSIKKNEPRLQSVPMKCSSHLRVSHNDVKLIMTRMPINHTKKSAQCPGCGKWFKSFHYYEGFESSRGLHITNIQKHIIHCNKAKILTALIAAKESTKTREEIKKETTMKEKIATARLLGIVKSAEFEAIDALQILGKTEQ